MTTIRFAFGNPRANGVDEPAAGAVRCALFQVEADSGRLRSTREFTFYLDDNGEAIADLSPAEDDQAWYIVVEGVEGIGERWVFVPESAEPVNFADLVLVDPSSIPILPRQRSNWADISALAVAAMQRAGDAYVLAQGAGAYRAELFYPGAQVVRVGTAALTWPWPVRIVRVVVTIAGFAVGASLIVDVNLNGTTIFPNQADRPQLIGTSKTVQKVVSVNVAALAQVTVDVDQIGSEVPGSDLVVTLFAEPV